MRLKGDAILLALALTACAGSGERVGAASHYQETGLASWYGDEAAGARTASGAPFDPDAVTAAHRTLPLGSYAEVTSLDTGRPVVVLVNDRGPGRRDRLIDLSLGAAQRLGMGGRSTTAVRVRAIGGDRFRSQPVPFADRAVARPPLAATGRYLVQVASFSYEPRARALAAKLGGEVVGGGALWRVRLGPFTDAETAQRARDAVAARGYGDARIDAAD